MRYRLAEHVVLHTAGYKVIELHGMELDNTYGSVQQVKFLHCNFTAR